MPLYDVRNQDAKLDVLIEVLGEESNRIPIAFQLGSNTL
jgi:hypothetical protein